MAFPTHVNDQITDSIAQAGVSGAPSEAALIAVAGVDAGAAIDVLAAEVGTQGSYATEARTLLEHLAKQISAVLVAPMPSLGVPPGKLSSD